MFDISFFFIVFLEYNKDMNRLEIINLVRDIHTEEKISFSIGSTKAYNRFDHENCNQFKEGDACTDISYMLYSYIACAIFFKAQGKEKAEKGYSLFDNEWESLIRRQEKDIFDNSKVVKDNAMRLLSAFLFSKEEVKLDRIMAKFSPLCLLKEIEKEPKKAKRTIRRFDKDKEVIFNQTMLFLRSLHHAFLSRDDIKAEEIHPDFQNLSSGFFSYQDEELLLPTWQNAFTLESFRNVAVSSLLKLSDGFPLSKIKKISIIYLVKDIVATSEL